MAKNRAMKVIIPHNGAVQGSNLQLRASYSSWLPEGKGDTKKSLHSPIFTECAQAASVGSAGDRDSHWGTLGWPLLLLSGTHLKEGETKVCWRSVRNIPLFSHTSSSGLTPTKKLLRSIYLINVFQQSTCLLGHHLSEVVPGFVVFIILFLQTYTKSVEIPADSNVGSEPAYPQKEVVIQLKGGKII